MKLVIFDLDQTLVDFISIHDEVTQKLFRRYFSVDARLTILSTKKLKKIEAAIRFALGMEQ